MERESFEDPEVALRMNEKFVSIKVDREERPDIDQIYMGVCQALTGSGGWPLTIIMTPDQKPFFAGTYFPKKTRLGRMGLMEVLSEISSKWENQRERVVQASEQILYHMKPKSAQHSQEELSSTLLDASAQAFLQDFDAEYGGFGAAPKFPTPHNLIFLLRYGYLQHRSDVVEMVEKTLQAMHRGGIYDHVGFGFSRYSTDKKWLVPHFEKMLYDNALLVLAYVEAYQVTHQSLYKAVAKDVLTYVLRDMTSPEGAFYSAEDADSEGVEGRFYTWSVPDVEAVLGAEDARLAIRYFGMSDFGNFEGFNIPNLLGPSLEVVAQAEGIDVDSLRNRLNDLRQRLFAAREKRIHPYKDDKILTAWNGLMIAALSYAGRVLHEDVYVKAAQQAAAFVFTHLRREDGRLLARYRDGESAHLGYVDDYAYLIWGLLELYEASFNPDYLVEANRLQEAMLDLFWDHQSPGFFFYGQDGERLILRQKEIYDGAMPSGNSVAALNLLRLGRITGHALFEERADQLLKSFLPQVKAYPMGYSFFMLALQFALGPTREIVIATAQRTEQELTERGVTEELITFLQESYLPNTILLFHPEGPNGQAIERLASFTQAQQPIQGRTAVYICENYACQFPITEIDQLKRQLVPLSSK